MPYSHLTIEELCQAIKAIITNICQHRSRAVVVVDVLGRYSIEWAPKWQENRWNYAMNFFESESKAEPTWMSFYSHQHLQEIMQKAAKAAGCPIEKLEFFDRSIMVGRHTSTRQFNSELPQYRNLINSLLDPSKETELGQLIFQVELGAAPEHITGFFNKFSSWWNCLVGEAMSILDNSASVDPIELPLTVRGFKATLQQELQQIPEKQLHRQKVEMALAQALRKLEVTQQPGYGVGHDLFGVMWLNASNI